MTYADAMARYGSDKPDLRFGVELTDLTGYFAGTEFRVFQAPYVGAVVMPGGASQTRRELDGWQDWAKSARRPRARVRAGRRGRRDRGPVAKNLSEAERPAWPRRSALSPATRLLRGRRGGPPRSCSARPGWRSAAGAS